MYVMGVGHWGWARGRLERAPRRASRIVASCDLLPPPSDRDFGAFPHPPYGIQTDFMQALYSALDAGGLALFESPTGTGKTLSLIVGALTWLEDKRAAEAAAAAATRAADAAAAVAGASLPPWLAAAAAERGAAAAEAAETRRQERLAKARSRRDAALEGGRKAAAAVAARKPAPAAAARRPPAPASGDAEFIIDDEDDPGAKRAAAPPSPPSSDGGASSSDADADADRPGAAGVRVVVTSRTHSQLAQFVGELRRTRFAGSVASVSLASRAALCVNDSVLALGSASRISEACLDLQTTRGKREAAKAAKAAGGRGPAAKGCPFRAPAGGARRRLRDALLASPLDVEEMAAAGREIGACPYYGAREAARDADVIFLPYPALLSADARAAMGVKLERSVIIVDEAHNLPGAVAGAASAALTRRAAAVADAALSNYLLTYSARLGPATRKDVHTLQAMCRGVVRAGWGGQEASTAAPSSSSSSRALKIDEFAVAAGLDNVNAFRLIASLRERKAVPKVAGAAVAAAARDAAAAGRVVASRRGGGGDDDDPSPVAALHALTSFLAALTTADADGRVIADATSLRFILLNAGARFGAVLASARAVVLASGTLEPSASLEAQLFPGGASDAAARFACCHVLPPDRLLATALGVGPTGVTLDFRHGRGRDGGGMIDELGRVLFNAVSITPSGVVAFFPSFAYMGAVIDRWQATGAYARLEGKKKVFIEPRSAAASAAALTAFSEAAIAPSTGGALMLCVIGAKLSEGINFGDGLGRLVVIVGLPFPNPADAELAERVRFLDAARAGAGRRLYEDSAMTAVNQAVGRVVRHARDWAAVLLVDVRYTAPPSSSRPPPTAKLPAWMRPCLRVASGYGDAHAALARFCRRFAAEGGG